MIWIMHEDFVPADTVGVFPIFIWIIKRVCFGQFWRSDPVFLLKIDKNCHTGQYWGLSNVFYEIFTKLIILGHLLDWTSLSKNLQKLTYRTISRTGPPSSKYLQKCSYLATWRAKSLILWTIKDKIFDFFSLIFSSITVSTHALYMTVVSYRTVRCSNNLGPCYIGIVNLQ